ncbi:MAG: SDR family NAD(P)-dependent oxidoreductase [Myxococcota bacterium]
MKNNIWFITGASKGLGLELAKVLVASGAKVAVTSRSKRALVEALGDKVLALEVDLLNEASVQAAIKATIDRFGGLDVVVNNAGYGQLGTIEELSDAEARMNFDVNVFGTLNVLRAALPHLRERRSGHIFNIGSIGGFVGNFPGWGIYCATKFAVAAVSEALQAELQEHGVNVTAVYPGYFRTEFLSRGSLGLPARPIAAYTKAHAIREQHLKEINGNQPGDPKKLAKALVDVAEQRDPPLHLFLGKDAYAMAEQKLASMRQTLESNRTTSVSTDI